VQLVITFTPDCAILIAVKLMQQSRKALSMHVPQVQRATGIFLAYLAEVAYGDVWSVVNHLQKYRFEMRSKRHQNSPVSAYHSVVLPVSIQLNSNK